MPSFKFLHWEESEERKASTIEYDDGESCTLILVLICEHALTQMTAVYTYHTHTSIQYTACVNKKSPYSVVSFPHYSSSTVVLTATY